MIPTHEKEDRWISSYLVAEIVRVAMPHCTHWKRDPYEMRLLEIPGEAGGRWYSLGDLMAISCFVYLVDVQGQMMTRAAVIAKQARQMFVNETPAAYRAAVCMGWGDDNICYLSVGVPDAGDSDKADAAAGRLWDWGMNARRLYSLYCDGVRWMRFEGEAEVFERISGQGNPGRKDSNPAEPEGDIGKKSDGFNG